MKRILFIWCLLFGMSMGSVYGDVGSLQVSGGVVAPYDVSASDSAVGWQVSYAAGVTDHVEIGAVLMKTGEFEVDNDITDGEAEVSALMIQGRWLFSPERKTRGFIDLAGGMMDVDAVTPSVVSSRAGGAARLGLGVDHDLSRNLAIRFSVGYTTGIGRTSEIDLIDAGISLVFGVRLFR
ncbi:hypothetical protein [Desulfoluna sp.]|uniref:hypothetical protein n=1 Tax=Desulfoluna sp. TaxID=2045199 RepID=UPI00260F11AD|nr:hypothetical protein [Desulfoluna sp.]